MNNEKRQFENCLVLLMSFPGAGKKTTGEVLAKKTNFKLAHEWISPILKLFGDDGQVMWDLEAEAWKKLNAADDLILSTIADVCPKENSYVIPQMMFDQDPYHQIFYDKVLSVVEKRKAHFFPVRLLCDEAELRKRVQSKDRGKYFKTRDVELSNSRSREKAVFYSNHPNEITINNTHKMPDEVTDIIIDHIQKMCLLHKNS